MQRKRLAALAAVLTVSCVGAHATASASVTFSDIRLTLVDLNPNDGIDPYFHFSALSEADALAVTDGTSTSDVHTGTGFLAPAAAAVQPAAAIGASASLVGDVFGTGATAHAESVNSLPVAVVAQASGEISFESVGGPVNFELSPYTELVLTGDVDVMVSSDEFRNDAAALVVVYVDGATSQGPQFDTESVSLQTFSGRRGQYSLNQQLSLAFVNPDATATMGGLHGFVEALVASSIPEPATASLLLVGLVPLVRRKRQSTRAGGTSPSR